MAHIHTERSRFERTPAEWLAFGADAAQYVNNLAARDDIVAYVGEGAGHGAPACYVPHLAEMEIDTAVCFGPGFDASLVGNINERPTQMDHPHVAGALLHEAMHAKHSKWSLKEVAEHEDKFVSTLITMFEETRIESRGVTAHPRDRAFLRACSLKIVLADLKDDEDFAARGIKGFSQLMLLTLARIDAGVLDAADVKIIQDAADRLFDKKTMKKLRSIWCRAQKHSIDTDWKPLEKLAYEWIDVLAESGNDPKDDSPESLPEWLKDLMGELMGEPGDESGSGSGGGESGDDNGDAEVHEAPGRKGLLEQMADETETDARDEANAQAARERAEAMAEARGAAAEESRKHSKSAGEVYGKGTGPGGGRTSSRLSEERLPNAEERRAAVALAKALEQAQYRDRIVTRDTSVLPPGRLNARRAMAAAEQRSRGVEVTAEAWTRKQRKHTEDPNLTVGVLVDISGSMSYAMEPMASTAWIMSEAVRRVQGKVSMVYYGDSVFPTLLPGQHMTNVQIYTAPDSTEKFNRAFEALNGKINLLDGSGARLLVIVSDIYYTGYEGEQTKYWIERCARAGVGVVVVPFEYGEESAKDRLRSSPCEIIPASKTRTLVGAANAIGQAAVKQLRRASS